MGGRLPLTTLDVELDRLASESDLAQIDGRDRERKPPFGHRSAGKHQAAQAIGNLLAVAALKGALEQIDQPSGRGVAPIGFAALA
jgi:hypothetical protein